jgi:tRNA/rRNA methyltransferase
MKVVLVRPEHPGNVGAVARVMKNFGFSELVLVSPVCDYVCEDARRRAKHAVEVLERAVVVSSLKNVREKGLCDWLAGTSAVVGSDDNLARLPLTPRELAKKVGLREGVGVVFGPESDGLSNEEVLLCDVYVSIPTCEEYPSLNLSHAVGVLLYELSLKRTSKKRYALVPAHELDLLQGLVDEVIDSAGFETAQKCENQKNIWKRLLGKATLTRREAHGVMGLMKKMLGNKKQ